MSFLTETGSLTPAPVDLGCWFGPVSLQPQPQRWREQEQRALWSWCYRDQTQRPWRISPKVSESRFVQIW